MVNKRRFPFGFGFGDDFFGSDVFEEMEKMMREMRSISPEEMEKGNRKSFVWGFNAKMSPEGKWEVEEFGNKPVAQEGKGKMKGIGISEEREPLIDIIEGKDTITVIAEIPGVSKEDINLSGTGKTLKIDVDTSSRKYHKVVSLPCETKPMSARASYKNGVLEVMIERIEKRKDDKEAGRKIKVD